VSSTDATPGPEGLRRSRGEMPLWDHLREFRRRVVRVLLAVIVGAAVGFVFFETYFEVLLGPYCALATEETCRVNAFRATDPITTRIRASVVVGLFLGGPVLFYQLWRFITPGLTTRERRLTLPFVVLSQVMFGLGLAFAWWFIPRGLEVLLRLGGDSIVPLLGAKEYLSFLLSMALAFGLVFEIPLVLVFLATIGVISSDSLRRARRFAIVINTVIAAMVTPTDALSLVIVAVPLIVFYELAIAASWLIERARRKA
jgi:sec-independent protein translocase protein TatC